MNPETRTELAKLPGVREAAEEMAREAHDLFARFTWGVSDGWGELDDDAQETLIRVHLTLLCDLSRSASRDWWRRWLAERLKVEAESPDWLYDEGGPGHIDRDRDGGAIYQGPWIPASWTLWGNGGQSVAFAHWDEDAPPPPPGDGVDVWLTNWSTNPTEALAAACIHVGGLETR